MDSKDQAAEDAEFLSRFETLGEAEVSYLIDTCSIQGSERGAAFRWMKANEEERRALAAEQIRLGRQNGEIGMQAANAARAAVIVGVISILAAIAALVKH